MIPGPRPLYGYRWRDPAHTALETNSETAPVLQRIFHELADGKALRQVAKGLTRDGIPTPTGAPLWTAASLHYLIRQDAYIGNARAFRTKQERGHDGKYRNPAASAAHQVALPAGTVPALVDAETFTAVQARLARNKAAAVRTKQASEDALLRSGFAVCGYCGNNLAALKHSSGKRNYVCTSTVRARHGHRDFGMLAPKLDGLIWDWVKTRLSDPTTIHTGLESWRRENPHETALVAVDRRLSEITSQHHRLSDAATALEGEAAAAPLLVELRALAAQRRKLADDRQHLARARDDWESRRSRLDVLTTQCPTALANLDGLDYQGKRDLLAAFKVSVKVWATDHTPRFEATMQPEAVYYGHAERHVDHRR